MLASNDGFITKIKSCYHQLGKEEITFNPNPVNPSTGIKAKPRCEVYWCNRLKGSELMFTNF